MNKPPPDYVFRVDRHYRGRHGFEIVTDWQQAESLMDWLENVGCERRLTLYRRVESPADVECDDEADDVARVNDIWQASVAGGVAIVALCLLALCL